MDKKKKPPDSSIEIEKNWAKDYLLTCCELEELKSRTKHLVHEINNQLMGAISCLDMLQEEQESEQESDCAWHLDLMIEAMTKTRSLLQEFRAYQTTSSQITTIPVSDEIKKIINLLGKIYPKIAFEVSFQSKKTFVMLQKSTFRNILMRLMQKISHDISLEGRVCLQVKTLLLDENFLKKQKNHPKPGMYVQISIDRSINTRSKEGVFPIKDFSLEKEENFSSFSGEQKNNHFALNSYRSMIISEGSSGFPVQIYFPLSKSSD